LRSIAHVRRGALLRVYVICTTLYVHVQTTCIVRRMVLHVHRSSVLCPVRLCAAHQETAPLLPAVRRSNSTLSLHNDRHSILAVDTIDLTRHGGLVGHG
jgi:hypothetical protein